MEILSYLKGKKAQKEIDKLNEISGYTEKYKNGEKDMVDKFADVNERLESLEEITKDTVMNIKVDELSKNVFANLNTHNLKVSAYLSAKRYEHRNMIFDDLKDTSSISLPTSSNFVHTPATSSIKKGAGSGAGIVEFKKIGLNSPIKYFFLTLSAKDNTERLMPIDLSFIDMSPDENGFYQEHQEFISDVIELPSEVLLNGVLFNAVSQLNKYVYLFIATEAEEDGEFNSWIEYNHSQVQLKKFVKLKVVFKNEKEEVLLSINEVIQYDGFYDKNKIILTFDDLSMYKDYGIFHYLEKANPSKYYESFDELPSINQTTVLNKPFLLSLLEKDQRVVSTHYSIKIQANERNV